MITGELEGIRVSWKVTIHPEESAELWYLEVKNKGKEKAQLLLVPYYQLDISFKDPYFGPVNLFRARISEEHHCLYIKNYSYRRDAEDYAVCFHSDKKIEKYELSKEAFLKVVWDGMIGIFPHFDDVEINAKLPLQWGDRIEVSRMIRGKKVFFDFVRSPVRGDDYDLVIYNHTILDYAQIDKVRKILVIFGG